MYSPRTRTLIAHVLTPVLLGAAVYLLWRNPTLLVFSWVRAVGLGDLLAICRTTASPVVPLLPGWFLYSFPDGLWVYSLTSFVLAVWCGTPQSFDKMAWVVTPALLGVGAEVLQWFRLIPGVFDSIDVIACILGSAAAIAWWHRFVRLDRAGAGG
jgi:hypothetical protein